jgi:hypothetical protein
MYMKKYFYSKEYLSDSLSSIRSESVLLFKQFQIGHWIQKISENKKPFSLYLINYIVYYHRFNKYRSTI